MWASVQYAGQGADIAGGGRWSFRAPALATLRLSSALLCRAKLGKAPKPLPKPVGNVLAKVLTWLGPKGLEFGRYSTDYHYIRNYIYVNRHMGAERAARHVPEFAKRLAAMYNQKGEIDAR